MKRELFQPGCLVLAMASTVLLVPHLNANIPGSVPQNAGNSRPASPPFGQTYDVLSQEWQLWDFMQAAPDNPTFGAPCGNGQSGGVWFLYGLPGSATSVTCAIPAGKALFFPIVNAECSSLEPSPF